MPKGPNREGVHHPRHERVLFGRIDRLANSILDQINNAKGGEPVPLATQLEVLAAVSKWMQVRNRIEDKDQIEGDRLDDLRRRLKDGTGHAPSRKADKRPEVDFHRLVNRTGGRPPDAEFDLDPDNGRELSALKARLPRIDDGGDDGDRDDAGGASDPAVDGHRGVRADVSGGDGGHDARPDRGGDL